MTATISPAVSVTVTQTDVQDFLFTEARLLDRWMLNEWNELFAQNSRYQIAPAGADDNADPSQVLFYVNDDDELRNERVIRLYKNTAYAENPHSLCRRLVSNVQILGGTDESFEVAANYVLYRTKFGATDMYHGHLLYDMSVVDGKLSIKRKTAFIDTQDLYAQAKVSVIL